MICQKLNRIFYGLSRMLHLSEFVWTLRSSVLVVFNNFLLIDATDRSKISSDQKLFFYRIKPIPLSHFQRTLPLTMLFFEILNNLIMLQFEVQKKPNKVSKELIFLPQSLIFKSPYIRTFWYLVIGIWQTYSANQKTMESKEKNIAIFKHYQVKWVFLH